MPEGKAQKEDRPLSALHIWACFAAYDLLGRGDCPSHPGNRSGGSFVEKRQEAKRRGITRRVDCPSVLRVHAYTANHKPRCRTSWEKYRKRTARFRHFTSRPASQLTICSDEARGYLSYPGTTAPEDRGSKRMYRTVCGSSHRNKNSAHSLLAAVR